ncbi:MAG: AAA family ATPase [Lachnospiraceae bacterium]|nr:AAA family ATPase [Lachnospiraceae bacterium]
MPFLPYNPVIFNTNFTYFNQQEINSNTKNDFLDYNYNFGELNQKDIDKRSYIYSCIISHPEKFFKAVHQCGFYDKNNEEFIFYDINNQYKYSYVLNGPNQIKYPFCQEYINGQPIDHIDPIVMIAKWMNFSYKKCLEYLYFSLINNKIFSNDDEKNNPDWYVQEKLPISNIINEYKIENIAEWIEKEDKGYAPRIYDYKNIHNRNTGKVLIFKNRYSEKVKIYYSFYRRFNNTLLKLIPVYPEKPYEFFNANNIYNAKCDYIIVPSEDDVPDGISNYLAPPFGIESIPDCAINDLKDLPIYIELPIFSTINNHSNINRYSDNLIYRLKEKFKNKEVSFLIRYINKDKETFDRIFYNEEWQKNKDAGKYKLRNLFCREHSLCNVLISFEELLNAKEIIIRDPITISSKTNIVRHGNKIPGADRNRKNILDPIIKSGMLVWFFAKEKVGKSWLALSIAYACAKGNRPVGKWQSHEPCNVIYVDGELPGDVFEERCDMIMKGFHDETGYKNIPFDIYLYFEETKDYPTITCEEWLEDYEKSLYAFDLVIFDSYFSLNENKINTNSFLKLIKRLRRKNIAVIVVDHTNSDDELQGSAVKKRASDHGIKLDRLSKGKINVLNQFDRFGISEISPDHQLQFIFSNDSFEISKTLKEENKNCININERIYAICYVLFKRNIKTLQDIEKSIDIKNNTISSRNKKIASMLEGMEEKFKDVRVDMLKKEIERLFELPEKDIQDEFNNIKNSLKNEKISDAIQ